MRKLLALACLVASLAVGTVMAQAQSYPSRPIKLVLTTPAGGPNEFIVRILAERLGAALGQPVVVDNRPGGAGGTIGAKFVAGADPDGHTLMFVAPGPLVIAPAVYKNIGYDPLKDFAPIATVFSSPQLLAIHPSLAAKSIRELVADAKARPGKIQFASPGYGTQPHLLGEMLKQVAGIDLAHIPYRGAAPAMTDLLAGQVQMIFEIMPLLLPQVQDGKLRVLATAADARMPQLPDVPTTAEAGFPQLQATFWSGILAPAGTPAPIVDKLNATINAIIRSPEIEAGLTRLNATPKVGSPQDFAAFMATEAKKWAQVANAAGVKVD
jgi:tripartite-type tricarboxylate transporter receptor subunit TctC